ncbi:MAG: hypothetical protein LQ352_007186, partial [Teloschistes flavicans]
MESSVLLPHWSGEPEVAANPPNVSEFKNVPGSQVRPIPVFSRESESKPTQQKSAPLLITPVLDIPHQKSSACSAPMKPLESPDSESIPMMPLNTRVHQSRDLQRAFEQELLTSMDDSGSGTNTLDQLQATLEVVFEVDSDLEYEPGTGPPAHSECRYETYLGSRVAKQILGEMGLGDHSRAPGKPSFRLPSEFSGELLDTHTGSQPDGQHQEEPLHWTARWRRMGQRGLKRAHDGTTDNPRRKRQRQEMLPDGPRKNRCFFAGDDLVPTDQREQDKYDKVKTVGQGGEGTAHLLKSRNTGSLVVCKVIFRKLRLYQPPSPYTRGDELFFLRDALPPNPRIIHLHSALTSPTQVQLYLGYCDGGDLSSLLRRTHYRYNPETRNWDYHRIPESFIWHVFLQLAEALAYIHHGRDQRHPDRKPHDQDWFSVVHRDIKPENILLQRPPRGDLDHHTDLEPYPNLVLADFGMAIRALTPDQEPFSEEPCGTERYQAPERPLHSQKGDVYSLGTTICKLLGGSVPEENELPDNVDNDDAFERWEAILISMETESAGDAEFEDPWP